LHKLNDIELITDINQIILRNLEELQINELNFDNMRFDSIIKLLKTHRNKALIRKAIYNNIEKIILYNLLLMIDIKSLNRLGYYTELSHKLPKSIVLEIYKLNQDDLIAIYGVEEYYETMEYLENRYYDETSVDIRYRIPTLITFLIDLIELDEIGLAKKVLNILNDYPIGATIDLYYYRSLEDYLIIYIANKEIEVKVFNKFLDLIGENNFIEQLNQKYIRYDTSVVYLQLLFNKLVLSKKYDLLMKILKLLIERNHRSSQAISAVFPYLMDAMMLNDYELFSKYVSVLNSGLESQSINIYARIKQVGESK
jgi:hypothetical protein